MVRTAALILASTALALGAATARADGDAPFKIVSVGEVAKMVGAPDARFFDANNRDVFLQGHLPGAAFVEKPLAKLLPADKSTRLVFYCKNPK